MMASRAMNCLPAISNNAFVVQAFIFLILKMDMQARVTYLQILSLYLNQIFI